MQLDLDTTGRKVVLFGSQQGSRRAIARFAAAGARLTAVITELDPYAAPQPGVRLLTAPDRADRSALLRLVGPAWLVVLVDPGEGFAEEVQHLCAQLKIMTVTEVPAPEHGVVTLVGGGPGRTDLLTLAAVDALAQADVIFFDRLAPTAELERLAPTAELVDVGKTPYHHPISQPRIEQLMVDRARSGQQVVRLKGGDPFVFGRGGEEVLACARAGVAVRVVPGISSAVAVPGAAGVPVTHREVSRACTVISGHVPLTEDELTGLVGLGGTIVIMMGMANLPQILVGLQRAGMVGSTPAIVVQNGFGVDERRVTGSVADLAELVARHRVGSPAVVVIGAVVSLAESIIEATSGRVAVPGGAG